MGKVSDYVDSLKDKGDLDPGVIANTLLELHNEEIDTYNSKIASLELATGEKDTQLAAKDAEITRVKAKNWDLVNQVGVSKEEENPIPKDEPPADLTMDEIIFGKE